MRADDISRPTDLKPISRQAAHIAWIVKRSLFGDVLNVHARPRVTGTRLLLVLLIYCVTARPTLAWGPEGHETIAAMAEFGLSPKAKAGLRNLLAGRAESLADIANWADMVKSSRPETAAWHFVDIPVWATGYDPGRDCKDDNCVVAQISLKARQLSDPTLLPVIRLEALKFVVHLVGDVHQPLHCADNDDRGGNEIRVRFEGRTQKLHKVWDSGLIDAAANEGDYAARLFQSITPADRIAWSSLDPIIWANECFALAKSRIYERLNLAGSPGPHGGLILLPPHYAATEIGIVETQLKRAAVRLTAVLEATLGR